MRIKTDLRNLQIGDPILLEGHGLRVGVFKGRGSGDSVHYWDLYDVVNAKQNNTLENKNNPKLLGSSYIYGNPIYRVAKIGQETIEMLDEDIQFAIKYIQELIKK